jgi:hypothetical protein
MAGLTLAPEGLHRTTGLLDDLLALNNRSAAETSLLDTAGLEHMVAEAFVALHVPGAQALLVAFDEQADYDSPNFRWFKDRHERFVYIDRIIVDERARGQGLARALYGQLFDLARGAGHTIVGCEVNAMPPNPGSDAFHASLGFVEAGRAALNPGKTVRYLTRALG